MNAFEYVTLYTNLQEEIKSISPEAIQLAIKVFGTFPANDTVQEILNPTAISLEDAKFCQELLNCK